ncbi:MAG: ribonuclease Y [Actinobacteria bacterium RBG_13_63_9]|nr:MAG: ribonuclease Y [Actinobacteria bacterium RBG_13_63_9]
MMAILLSLAGTVIGLGAGFWIHGFVERRRINSSKRIAGRIVGTARKEAEALRSEATLKARDAFFEARASFELETREERSELRKLESRLLQREEVLDRRFQAMETRAAELDALASTLEAREQGLAVEQASLRDLRAEGEAAIARAGRLSVEEARREILDRAEIETRYEAARRMKRVEEEIRAEVEKNAKRILSLAMSRYAGEYVIERTVSVVHLPSDEMKGRIIGREGRNIRALEAATGIDVIIDETPESVVLSGFDPLRREVAKIALERLVQDGRIHPARIEEVVEKVKREIDTAVREAGEQATFDVGVHDVHPDLIKLIGRLRYRTSYTQNQYQHALEVAYLNGIIASELGLDVKEAKRAGLLHDLGKAIDHEVEGPHALIGADLAKKYGESLEVVQAIAGHHDVEPPTLLAVITQASDALSGARPGARKQLLENYVQRLRDIEATALKFPGVENAYAIQAGRELRVIVNSDRLSDEEAYLLSRDIARRIEKEMTYPGQIKVTVIRETRAVEIAK